MTKSQARTAAWCAFFGMVAFIASTLALAFEVSSFLRARYFLWSTVKCLFAFAALWFGYLLAFGAGLRSPRVYLRTLPALAVYVYAMAEMRKSPAERFHFLEYAILYLLALRAISIDLDHLTAYILAFVATFLAGWLDEGLQGLTPQRYFDWGDVRMNAVAAASAAAIAFSLFGARPSLARFPYLPRPRNDADEADEDDDTARMDRAEKIDGA